MRNLWMYATLLSDRRTFVRTSTKGTNYEMVYIYASLGVIHWVSAKLIQFTTRSIDRAWLLLICWILCTNVIAMSP
jgi:hypothetical protein